jgi:TrpR-related protein YerC/YecD
MTKLHNNSMDRLFQTILNLQSIEECYDYFVDLCTVKELQDMAQRLDTAALLAKGTSYQQICQRVGVSTATVGRVSKCLNYGTGGYRTALDRLEEEEV